MPKISQMTGTPWHIEKFTRAEGDSRRHRSRCIYLQKDDSFCLKLQEKCRGTAHCSHYDEMNGLSEQLRTDPKFKAFLSAKNQSKEQDKNQYPKYKNTQTIDIKEISVNPKKFAKPSLDAVNNSIIYYKTHGNFDSPVSLLFSGKNFYLENGYLQYYVAKFLKLTKIEAIVKINLKSFKPGTHVWHPQQNIGIVTNIDNDLITVCFENKKVIKFNTFDALINKHLKRI